jgi:5-methylcytosine-specific restriction endonuclease McrA
MSDVLVLNAAYQPVSVIPWQTAITKMYSQKSSERVEIVLSYAERVIRTATASMPMPSVVRHVKFTRPKSKGIKFSRDNVWARDRGRCQYCGIQVPRGGTNGYTYDHVIPKSVWKKQGLKGSPTNWENIVAACSLCNAKKSNRTPDEAKMRLRATDGKYYDKPIKPTHLPEAFKKNSRWLPGMPEEWKAFFNNQYWHGDGQ